MASSSTASAVLAFIGLLALSSIICLSSAIKTGEDHPDVALRALMDKLDDASEEQKRLLLLTRRSILVSLDRNATKLAVSFPIDDLEATKEQGSCPAKTTGLEKPRYVFLKEGKDYHGYCLLVSPCLIPGSNNDNDDDTMDCVFHLEEQLKEVHQISLQELIGNLESVQVSSKPVYSKQEVVPAASSSSSPISTASQNLSLFDSKAPPPSGRSLDYDYTMENGQSEENEDDLYSDMGDDFIIGFETTTRRTMGDFATEASSTTTTTPTVSSATTTAIPPTKGPISGEYSQTTIGDDPFYDNGHLNDIDLWKNDDNDDDEEVAPKGRMLDDDWDNDGVSFKTIHNRNDHQKVEDQRPPQPHNTEASTATTTKMPIMLSDEDIAVVAVTLAPSATPIQSSAHPHPHSTEAEKRHQAHVDSLVAYYTKSIAAVAILFVLFICLVILFCYFFYKRWQNDLAEVSTGRAIIGDILDPEQQKRQEKKAAEAAASAAAASAANQEKSADLLSNKLSRSAGVSPMVTTTSTYTKMASPRLMPPSPDSSKYEEGCDAADKELHHRGDDRDSSDKKPVTSILNPRSTSSSMYMARPSGARRSQQDKVTPGLLEAKPPPVPIISPPPATPRSATRNERSRNF